MSETLSLSKTHRRGAGWFRGDFHCHTHHSDGVLPPPDLLALARTEGLDFFAITDHNTIDSYSGFGDEAGTLIIPGIEATLKEGHFNVFGLADGAAGWVERLTAGEGWRGAKLGSHFKTMADIMRATAEQGWLNSINHPLLKPWEWREAGTELRLLDCLEIWNDPSWPANAQGNPAAVALWTDLLNAGYRITGIGGSDFHRPAPAPGQNKPAERLGLPSTYVYAEELSGEAILHALRARRAYVSMGPTASFEARAGNRTFGIGDDLGERAGKVELRGEVRGAAGGRARIVKNGEVKVERELDLGSGRSVLEWQDEVAAGETAWYRLEAWDSQGQLLVITNPIYAGPSREPRRQRVGDFVPGLS